ncbi:MAG: TIGR02281 family clan AA aspartic protease [Gammaproteobacteria bacterium]|nr:TIGR02281 family clan AA aspartic protease [Gammaproteobacteria bacterium]
MFFYFHASIIPSVYNESRLNEVVMKLNDPKQESRRIGHGMIAAGFVLGIVLLTFMFDGVLENDRNPNSNPDSHTNVFGAKEVILQSNRQGQYVLTGSINNVTAEFILDTGATDVVIPEGLARASGLEYGFQSQAMTANGLVNIYTTRINELRLGSITLEDVRASINPAMHESMVLLGMSALRQIEFVQQGAQLTLIQKATD